MDNQQLLMFKGWFIDSYPECKDYLDLTYFDVEKSSFIAKCSYNPDSGIAAKVLRIAFGSWQHQQAKAEELQTRVDRALKSIRETCDTNCNLATDDYHYLVEELVDILGGKIVEELEQALKGEGQ